MVSKAVEILTPVLKCTKVGLANIVDLGISHIKLIRNLSVLRLGQQFVCIRASWVLNASSKRGVFDSLVVSCLAFELF